MPPRTHSRATRLAAAFLAQQTSTEVAGKAFGVDKRTVQRWLDAGDIPDDAWTAIRDVLLARGAEMAARGETKGIVQVLTAAGISERNVRYGMLIARREARHAVPEHEQRRAARAAIWAALPDDDLLTAYCRAGIVFLRRELQRRTADAAPVTLGEQSDGALGDVSLLGPAIAFTLRRLIDTSNLTRPDSMPDWSTADDYAERVARLRDVTLAAAQAWDRTYIEAMRAGVTLYRHPLGGWELRREGSVVASGGRGTHPGREYAAMPALVDDVPDAARDVTPAEAPPRAAQRPLAGPERSRMPNDAPDAWQPLLR